VRRMTVSLAEDISSSAGRPVKVRGVLGAVHGIEKEQPAKEEHLGKEETHNASSPLRCPLHVRRERFQSFPCLSSVKFIGTCVITGISSKSRGAEGKVLATQGLAPPWLSGAFFPFAEGPYQIADMRSRPQQISTNQ